MTWNDISIKQYERIAGLPEMDEIDLAVELLSIINNISVDTYYDMDIKDFQREVRTLEFLKETPKGMFADEIVIDGTRYILQSSVEKMTTSQYIDLQTALQKENNLATLMSIMYIPKGKKYQQDYSVKDQVKLFSDRVSIEVAKGASDFFYLTFSSLTKTILSSSMKKLRKAYQKEKDTQKKNMILLQIKKLEESVGLLQLNKYQTLQN